MSTTKKAKAPVKTSDRKRPNRQFIESMAKFRGYMTGNEKLSLKTLEVKNALQRINNKAMSDDVNNIFNSNDVNALIKILNNTVKEINAVLK